MKADNQTRHKAVKVGELREWIGTFVLVDLCNTFVVVKTSKLKNSCVILNDATLTVYSLDSIKNYSMLLK